MFIYSIFSVRNVFVGVHHFCSSLLHFTGGDLGSVHTTL